MAKSYFEVLTDAINEMTTYGFDSASRVAYWQDRLKEAAEGSMLSLDEMERNLKASLTAVYTRLVTKGGLIKYNPGISRFTVNQLTPKLRAELTRRIMASADLIVLNRRESVNKTLSRFSGWATSIPKGGSKVVDKIKVKKDIRKSLTKISFEDRRVSIDQGHKLISSLNDIVADDGGAIAAIWNSNWRRSGYNYRKDHKERDQKVYLIRNSWAQKDGLVKVGAAGYADEIDRPSELPYCSCFYEHLYNIRDLPPEMVTKKGQDKLNRVRELIANA